MSAASWYSELDNEWQSMMSTRSGGKQGWIPSNINKGHYDHYFWLLSALNMANFVYFLACCKAYGPCRVEVRKALDNADGMQEEC
ncbi:hypothetical protein CUMW_114030 [Citrus unshiu]|nr:hypothetical protein CUMW_114030 [Citrus unshiu]